MWKERNLGLEPIELVHMGNTGSVGPMGDTAAFLNSKLRQNIAFAAYFEPKTIEEIAKELNVGIAFVEDEVLYLEEYGFLDLMPGQKYRTNIYIECVPFEIVQQAREISLQVAKLICDEYVPKVIALAQNYSKEEIYVPDEDFNYFLWTLLIMAVTNHMEATLDWDMLRRNNYMVKRKDGGEFVALATLYQKESEELMKQEFYCGPMSVGNNEARAYSWSLSTVFEDREHGWQVNETADYKNLVLFMKGKLPKTEAVLDKYVRLYERGLLRQEDDRVNVIVVKENPQNGLFVQMDKEDAGEDVKVDNVGALRKYIPPMSSELKGKIEALAVQKINLQKEYMPEHMHKLVEVYESAKHINPIMVINELLKRGTLKPLTDAQKKGVMIAVYSDVLPNEC